MRHADTAITNVPIDKRGGGTLDAQIDRWKRETRTAARHDAKVKAAQRREDKAMAKAVLAEHGATIIAHYGPRFGAKALRDTLDGWAKWEPVKLIDFIGKWLDDGDREARAGDAPDPNLPF